MSGKERKARDVTVKKTVAGSFGCRVVLLGARMSVEDCDLVNWKETFSSLCGHLSAGELKLELRTLTRMLRTIESVREGMIPKKCSRSVGWRDLDD